MRANATTYKDWGGWAQKSVWEIATEADTFEYVHCNASSLHTHLRQLSAKNSAVASMAVSFVATQLSMIVKVFYQAIKAEKPEELDRRIQSLNEHIARQH